MNDGMIIQQLLFCSVSKHRHISERRLTRKKPSSSQSFLGLLFYSHDATTHLALPVWFSNMNPFICQATLSMLVIRGDSNQLCVFFSVRLEIHVWVWWKSWFVFECACWVSVNLWRLQLLSFFQHSNAASPQLLVRNTAQEETVDAKIGSYGLSGFFYGGSQVSRSRVSQSVIRGDGLSVLLQKARQHFKTMEEGSAAFSTEGNRAKWTFIWRTW